MPSYRCPDCHVQVGEPHAGGCDVARCLATGLQRLTCNVRYIDDDHIVIAESGHDCGHDVWLGEMPGMAECRAYGFFCRLAGEDGLVQCGESDPGALHDLNRLVRECWWDRETRCWRRFEDVRL